MIMSGGPGGQSAFPMKNIIRIQEETLPGRWTRARHKQVELLMSTQMLRPSRSSPIVRAQAPTLSVAALDQTGLYVVPVSLAPAHDHNDYNKWHFVLSAPAPGQSREDLDPR